MRNCFFTFTGFWVEQGSTFSTLKRTVLDSGRHWPMVAMSPSLSQDPA